MAQERAQTPTGRKRIMRLDGSVVDELGNVVSEATATPGLPFSTPNPSEGADLGSGMNPKEFVAAGIKGLTAATSFLPGTRLPAMALRTILGAGGDAGAAAVEGEDPLNAAMLGGAMNAGGEAAGKVIPAVTTRAALATSGDLRHLKDIGPMSRAFNREAERRSVPIAVGERGRVKTARGEAAAELEAAESANPNKVKLTRFQGANAGLHQDSINTMDGLAQREVVDAADQRFIESQALMRNNLDDKDLRYIVTRLHGAFQQLVGPQAAPSLDQIRQALMNRLVDATELSARELGELMRGVRSQGKEVVKARTAGTWVPPGDAVKGQVAANNSKRMRDLYGEIDEDTRTLMQKLLTDDVDGGLFTKGKRGDMARANSRFSDIARMQEASQGIRRDLSSYGIRGALGETIGQIFGLPWGLGSAMGIAANPYVISGAGFAASKGAKHTPAIYRGAEAAEDFQEGTGVRRRKPK